MRSTPRRSGAELTENAEPTLRVGLFSYVLCAAAVSGWAAPSRVHAMHLADGMLPASSCLGWALFSFAFVAVAFRRFDRARLHDPQLAPLMAMLGAAVFAISCMPVPVPLVGTCSHPCGTGLAAIIVGPLATVLITAVALLLQALFLAHGGLTTLGADIASMGIAGGLSGYLLFHGARRAGIGVIGAAFVAGVLSDWATYATTALELTLGLHGTDQLAGSFAAVCLAFAPTQLPLGLLEGALTAGALGFLQRRRPALLTRLRVLRVDEV
jgi:cobalt/nickel transport system permease protein